jgi:hypothetical protein
VSEKREQSAPQYYVASRASVPERGQMWRRFRSQGMKISATWIDEDGRGETSDFGELWQRLEEEIKSSTALLLYVEPDDFPLKGALVEVGMAIAMGKPVLVFHPGVEIDQATYRPLGSWIKHPGVVLMTSCIEDWAHPAVPVAAPAVPKEYSVLRFRHGKRMAEGARVTASCEDEALDKARRLFYPLGDGETFEIGVAMEAQGAGGPESPWREIAEKAWDEFFNNPNDESGYTFTEQVIGLAVEASCDFLTTFPVERVQPHIAKRMAELLERKERT